jgi:hypothetical protein
MDAYPILYAVKAAPENEELRYSLRSLDQHLPHTSVTFVGGRPAWTGPEVQHLPGNPPDLTKGARTTYNWLTGLTRLAADGHTRAWVCDDDVYALADIAEPFSYHRGTLAAMVATHTRKSGHHYIGAQATITYLHRRYGLPDPLSYELHLPMLVHIETMLAVCRTILHAKHVTGSRTDLHKRSIYGNLIGMTTQQWGTPRLDVKVYHPLEPLHHTDFVSTTDATFRNGLVGQAVRRRFPLPSRYEA